MKHLKRVSLPGKASSDIGETMFFQMYFMVIAMMITAAMSGK